MTQSYGDLSTAGTTLDSQWFIGLFVGVGLACGSVVLTGLQCQDVLTSLKLYNFL